MLRKPRFSLSNKKLSNEFKSLNAYSQTALLKNNSKKISIAFTTTSDHNFQAIFFKIIKKNIFSSKRLFFKKKI